MIIAQQVQTAVEAAGQIGGVDWDGAIEVFMLLIVVLLTAAGVAWKYSQEKQKEREAHLLEKEKEREAHLLEKEREHEARVLEKQQEIYSKLAKNIMEQGWLVDRLKEDQDYQRLRELERESGETGQVDAFIEKNYPELLPELALNWRERGELFSLLCVYGPDDAVRAALEYVESLSIEAIVQGKRKPLKSLLYALRKAVFSETKIKAGEMEKISGVY